AFIFRERRCAVALLAIAFAGAGAAAYQLEKGDVDPLRLKAQIDSGAIMSGDPVEIEGRVKAVEPIPDGMFMTVAAERAGYRDRFGEATGNVRMVVPVRTAEARADLAALELIPGTRM